MKSAFAILMICFVFVACGEKSEPLKPLQKGKQNTKTLSTGDVVYDINGEWDAIIDDGPMGKTEDILKITQEGNKFVGIATIETPFSHKGSECIKGELEKNGFKSVEINTLYFAWMPSIGKIDDGCNKIVVKTRFGGKGSNTLTTTLTRK